MSAAPIAPYEAYALCYATRSDTTSRETYYRYELYGEPDRQITTGYYFWLIRNQERTVLVDCGFSEATAARRGRPFDTSPLELLDRLDVRPKDVDHVVLSHMHFDHVGNIGLFPHATFSMARTELEFWSGPYGSKPTIGWAIEPGELQEIQGLDTDGRLRLTDGRSDEVLPGIRLTVLPGHTPGQLTVEVDTAAGQVVLASDAVHYYDQLEQDRPFQIFTDLPGMYRGLDHLRTLAARPATTVVAGHDPAVMEMFEAVAPQCVDLTRRLS